MVEEIKKTLLNVKVTKEEYETLMYNTKDADLKVEYMRVFKYHEGLQKGLEIALTQLDKYNNQPDYKSAFEKILDIQMDIDGTTFGECFDTQVQDIKDEYNLGGE